MQAPSTVQNDTSSTASGDHGADSQWERVCGTYRNENKKEQKISSHQSISTSVTVTRSKIREGRKHLELILENNSRRGYSE